MKKQKDILKRFSSFLDSFTLLVTGPPGAGKSSFINSLRTVLEETSLKLEKKTLEQFYCFKSASTWLMAPGYPDYTEKQKETVPSDAESPLGIFDWEPPHLKKSCVILVLKYGTKIAEEGINLQAQKQVSVLHVVVTDHSDSTDDGKKCKLFGIPGEQISFINNYTTETVCHVLDSIMKMSEDSIMKISEDSIMKISEDSITKISEDSIMKISEGEKEKQQHQKKKFLSLMKSFLKCMALPSLLFVCLLMTSYDVRKFADFGILRHLTTCFTDCSYFSSYELLPVLWF